MKLLFLAFLFVTARLWAVTHLAMGTPSQADTIVDREGYALGYSETHEQPQWVLYILTKEKVETKVAKRSSSFRGDPLIPTGSAQLKDYRHSGYDRGHMAPAADMAWSETAMKECFYFSNMSPQIHAFNGGVWSRLEEKMRDWAVEEGEIYIVTGPLLPEVKTTTIGPNEVTVPEGFYKAVFAPQSKKAIGFYLSHEASKAPLQDFTLSIDELEEKTGLDFFSEILTGEDEAIEATFTLDAWAW